LEAVTKTPIEQLIEDMSRPVLVYRMAHGRANTQLTPAQFKSVERTRERALDEIDDIVRAYVIANPGTAE
jgi:hypothetical protein